MNSKNYYGIKNLIVSLQLRPKMFLKEEKLDYVYYLLTGYITHLFESMECQHFIERNENFQRDFLSWVMDWALIKFNKNYAEGNEFLFWYQIIEQNTNSNEEAMKTFYELSRQFFLERFFNWKNPECETTYGTTFTEHGSHHEVVAMMIKAREQGRQLGQWTDDKKVAEFIAKIAKEKGVGVHDVPLPRTALEGFPSVVYLSTGMKDCADKVRVIVNEDGSVKTAYPFSSVHPN